MYPRHIGQEHGEKELEPLSSVSENFLSFLPEVNRLPRAFMASDARRGSETEALVSVL